MSRRNKFPPGSSANVPENDSPFVDPVAVPIEDCIDLHPFAPRDIPSVVEEYIAECVKAGLSEVRIIHGRGTGVQRNIVRSILEKHSMVVDFRDAPAEAGGWGATVVVLKSES
ncbi:MAG TPA: Smr/MutS family protein [Candidatus Binatia bacterium]|nr:Smr/MutS family protein [Candidatus Binatia bacterium]